MLVSKLVLSLGPVATSLRRAASPLSPSVLVTVALCLGASLYAQLPRPAVEVTTDPASNPTQPEIAIADGLSAICWADAGELLVATSDGRGIVWNPPVRVDADLDFKKNYSVHVSGDAVYVFYTTFPGMPYPDYTLRFVRSTDRGATFSAPVTLDAHVGSWAVSTTRVGGVDRFHLLQRECDSTDCWVLRLLSSLDGGASFGIWKPFSAPCPPTTWQTFQEFGVAAAENVVHLAWVDDREVHDRIYYQRSSDSGATLLPCDVLLSDESPRDFLRIAVLGNTVAVLWNEFGGVRANVSTDGGVTFSGARTVSATPVGSDTGRGDVAIDPSTGAVLVVFESDRTGIDEAYAATSFDGGMTWLAETQLSNGGTKYGALLATGEHTAAVSWNRNYQYAESRESADGGLTWGPLLTLNDPALGSVQWSVKAAHAEGYRNYVVTWRTYSDTSEDIFAGGFRPQTLTPIGWTAGPSNAGFAFERFDPAYPLGGVLLSGSLGSLLVPFGDGRDVGLLTDAWLLRSINLFTGPLGAAIDATGTGATPMFPIDLPPGLAVWAVGYQVSFTGSVKFGDLSDTLPIAL